LHKAKEAIKNVFNGESERYFPFWKIIDERWNKSLYYGIHVTTFYLNPHLFHDGHLKMNAQVKAEMKRVMPQLLSYGGLRLSKAQEVSLMGSNFFRGDGNRSHPYTSKIYNICCPLLCFLYFS